MNKIISDHIGNLLIDAGNKIKAGTCEISENEALDILKTISHQPLSREEVCSKLKISNNKLYELIDKGKLPKGRKRRGFKELVWYLDEINEYNNNLK